MCAHKDLPPGAPEALLLQVCQADPDRTLFEKIYAYALTDVDLCQASRTNCLHLLPVLPLLPNQNRKLYVRRSRRDAKQLSLITKAFPL